MGFEENIHSLFAYGRESEPPRFYNSASEGIAREREREARALQDANADATAVWVLADMAIPKDLKDWGERHHMPEFAQMCWRSAFVEGWRAKARADEQGKT